MNSKIIGRYRFQIIRLIHSGSVNSNRASPVVDSIIRVDHAGELGADRIYAGQMAILGNSKMGPVIQHMWDQEKVHKETFEKLIVKYRARPTIMVPIWNVAGFLLGAGTALMGEKAAMACTVAVESVIVDHYNDQLRTLMAEPEKNKELLETIQKFRDEEQEHHDSGLDHGAEQAPFYKGLTEVIKLGCKTAIAISKDMFATRRLNYLGTRSYHTRPKRVRSEPEITGNWDLYGGLCLERKPVIMKSFNKWEQNFSEVLCKMELEKSFKSDHEVRHQRDIQRIAAWKADTLVDQAEIELLSKETAQEFEDKCTAELEKFKESYGAAEQEEIKDMRSLERELDKSLYLVTRDAEGNLALPTRLYQRPENLRETAERTLLDVCGDNVKAIFLGNAPCGFYKYLYPESQSTSSVGAKIFYFKAIYRSGKLSENHDYQWVTRKELLSSLKTNKVYRSRIKMFLLDDRDIVYPKERGFVKRKIELGENQ